MKTKEMVAYCFRDGRIELGRKAPEGALVLGRGGKKFQDRVAARCRWAHDNRTMLVPGVPEAEASMEALDAVEKFSQWIKK